MTCVYTPSPRSPARLAPQVGVILHQFDEIEAKGRPWEFCEGTCYTQGVNSDSNACMPRLQWSDSTPLASGASNAASGAATRKWRRHTRHTQDVLGFFVDSLLCTLDS